MFGAVACTMVYHAEEAVKGYEFAVLCGMVSAAVRLEVVPPLTGQAIQSHVLSADLPRSRPVVELLPCVGHWPNATRAK